MGNPEQDGTGGMPDFGGEKGMKDVYDSLFQKPRREHDPRRKVGRDAMSDRLLLEQDFGRDGTTPK